LSSNYDAFVCGSDQIWNPNFFGLDPAYYLQFAPINKRVAYAPSLGVNHLTISQKIILKKFCSEIPYISVREAQGARLVQNIIDKPVLDVLDPTFLVDNTIWLDLANKFKKPHSKKYILSFFFQKDPLQYKYLNFLKNKLKLEIINIPHTIDDFLRYRSFFVNSPIDFLGIIKNAEYVITQSFHVMAFSILFEKEFIIFNRELNENGSNMISRINDLLEKLGIKNRVLIGKKDSNYFKIPEKIDYSIIRNNLLNHRLLSINFLIEAINKASK
jgi:hypothetical protein